MNNIDKIAENSVFIIDGSSFLYRAYYSIRPLNDPSGRPVQAVYGFSRMVKKLIDTYNPTFLVIAWDSPGKTVRHEVYSDYKATRQSPPSDLFQQKELIQKFADLIGIIQVQTPGIEADDLMYSLTQGFKKEKVNSILVTSDKDMGQTLDEYVKMLDPFKEEIIDQDSLKSKLGFEISKLPFYYALIGDSSDNIPGVKGVGPKGATELVKKFDSLEDLYNKIDTVTGRTKELLLASKDNAFLSYELFKLRYFELKIDHKKCFFDKSNWDQANPLFIELNFKSFLKNVEIPKQESEKKYLHQVKEYKFITVTTEDQLEEICQQVQQKKYCALDTEGTSLDPFQGSMVGISISMEFGKSYYIPFGHKTDEYQLSRNYVLYKLKSILENSEIEKFFHHAKFDIAMFYNEGIDLKGTTFDTMVAANLLVADGQRIGLKYLSDYYFQEPMLIFKDLEKQYKTFENVPLALATEYAAGDAHQTLKLYEKFKKGLVAENVYNIFKNIEMPLIDVLFDMEKEGIDLDLPVLENINIKVSKEIAMLSNEILDLIGPEFAEINLNSPKQLEELLFVHLKLPVIKKTAQKTGYSTDQEVLKDLAKIHPVPALIAKYRELYKLKSTYLDALGGYINPKTGKIHTTFSQTGVATGRLSSSNPNLQNIPVDRFHIRSAFKAPDGTVFLSADYSQIELRVLAYLSQDSTLIEAFNNNLDIHALTASGLFNVDIKNVTSEQRQLGKRINFSILYGLTPFGLSKDLDISHSVAKNYIDKFMAQYAGVSAWMAKVVEEVTQKGYVTTYWGRKRYLPGIKEKNKTLYDLAKRVAINTAAQGTAAEIVKIGMIQLDKLLKQKKMASKMILQIHDELILEVSHGETEEVKNLVKAVLENVTDWNVPLEVSIRTGATWQDITK